MELLYFIIIVWLFITWLNITSQEWFILYKPKKYLEELFEQEWIEWYWKPIYGCHICMSSFWSIFCYLLVFWLNWWMFLDLTIIIPSVATVVFYLNWDND